ncbi:MAG: radical SAM protein [Candidatus Aenigmatarchaeota archaeon]
MLWQKERNGIRCELCARRCFIPKGGKGFCLVRVNKDNKLYTLNYGKLIAVNVDPIEKKPLFHFYPGSSALSIASAGCNFRCQFCFDPSTTVLTDRGIFDFETLFNKGKPYEIEGGYVSFLDSIKTFTHSGKVSEIEKVYKHYYKGELIVIKPFHLPKIKATPSHEFFVYDKENKKIKKLPAREITKDHLLIIPKLQTETKGCIEGRKVYFSPYFRVKVFGKDTIANFLNGFTSQILYQEQSRFIENGNYFLVEIDKIEKEPYSGFVYNLEVKDEDHSYPSNFVFVANCCNASISQALVLEKSEKVPGEEYSPEDVVELAEKNNCKVISYTYTEPTIFYEFAFRVAKLAHRSNILNSFVTNGYITTEALKKFKYLDAATVDFKASADPEFYKKFMSVPSVEPIFESLKQMKKQRVHIEITNLIVPQIGDSIELCRKLAEWVNYELGPHVPFHVLQFHPDYKLLDLPFTPVSTLERCIEEVRKAGLRYVYIGNVPGHEDESTYCYNCREPLILREGFFVKKINLVKDRCPKCGFKIDVVVE